MPDHPPVSRRRLRRGLTALAAALAATAAAALTALPGAAPAMAAPGGAQDAPGAQIAAALRTSPLYIDPSLRSAFPAPARKALLSAIGKAPVSVFILAVPLVTGGQYATGEQLADVVQDTLARPGVYLTLDAGIAGAVDAWTWPSDPQGLDAPPYHAADAALAANLDEDTTDTPVWQTFLKCIQLITSGQAVSAYQAALTALPGGGQSGPAAGGNAAVGAAVIAVVFLAGLACALALRIIRRRARSQAPLPAATPQPGSAAPAALVAAARAATAADLRAQAEQQVIALGGLIEQQPGPADAGRADSPDPGQAEAGLSRALDAYAAAALTLDSASGIPDLAGVLVLTHIGRCAIAAEQARQPGSPPPPAAMLCFFNPLHGTATRQVRWRVAGGAQALDVRACEDCARAVAEHRLPAVLTGTSSGLDVPYYEMSSVWAATGYGQFGRDLAQQVLAMTPRPAARD